MNILKIRLMTYDLRVKGFTHDLWDIFLEISAVLKISDDACSEGRCTSLATTSVIASVISNYTLLKSLYLAHGTTTQEYENFSSVIAVLNISDARFEWLMSPLENPDITADRL